MSRAYAVARRNVAIELAREPRCRRQIADPPAARQPETQRHYACPNDGIEIESLAGSPDSAGARRNVARPGDVRRGQRLRCRSGRRDQPRLAGTSPRGICCAAVSRGTVREPRTGIENVAIERTAESTARPPSRLGGCSVDSAARWSVSTRIPFSTVTTFTGE